MSGSTGEEGGMEPVEEPKEGKRRHRRWVIRGHLTGRITATDDAALVDLSPGGAQIEHQTIVRPGTMATLAVVVTGRPLTLRCRVIWSRVHRTETRAGGERVLLYRTGLQFLDPSEAARRLLEKYLASLPGEGSESEPA